jgi:hypothetical protein
VSREDALQRLSLLGELIDPNPEHKATFSADEIAEFQKILTDGNYTVRQLMKAVGPAAASPWLLNLRFTDLSERR